MEKLIELHTAARVEVVKTLLVTEGVLINVRDEEGLTPLHIASSSVVQGAVNTPPRGGKCPHFPPRCKQCRKDDGGVKTFYKSEDILLDTVISVLLSLTCILMSVIKISFAFLSVLLRLVLKLLTLL